MAIPICISPELRVSGVAILEGIADIGRGDGTLLGLGSGVGSPPPLAPVQNGCKPFCLLALMLIWSVKNMSSLESLFSKFGLALADLPDPGPEDVLGLANMMGAAGGPTAWTGADVLGVLGGGGGGSGRLRYGFSPSGKTTGGTTAF